MGDKLVIGPINKGLKTNREPFAIDNDSFPSLINAYQWRGRIKRKRGTVFVARTTRFFNSTISSYTGTTVNPSFTITFDGSGNANLLGPYTNATPTTFSLQSNANIVPGSVTIVGSVGPVTYTDPTENGYLTPTGTGGPNTINYSTGAIHIPAQAGGTATVIMDYYPDLPVMGLEDLIIEQNQYPGNLAFDTKYSYNLVPLPNATAPLFNIYDVSFYKNVISNTYVGYIQKANWTPTSWNGGNYQQFWTCNYQGALWATNGIPQPFSTANVGMQFKGIVAVTVTAGGPPAIVNLQITAHGLVVGDFLFINEVTTTTGINFQTGYVTAVVDANNVTVEFPNATIANNGAGGIAQYLTNRSDPTKDCLRWYDGDPTNGSVTIPSFVLGRGWVNFAPPISQSNFSIADLPAAQYYLVGARMIVPFKDRLLFIGPIVQTSSQASQRYLQDTIVFSQNGTAFYTASFTGSPSSATTVYNPILVPNNQTATASAYFADQTGFGGNITAGVDQQITTSGINKDVLIIGFQRLQTQLVYTGDDIIPFNFFIINGELGSSSTFSSIVMDNGVLTKGSRGYVITNQYQTARMDLDIPDQFFQVKLQNNGAERVTSQRDYLSEWIYITYPPGSPTNGPNYDFPNQTLQYNYRDESWAIFNECYTTYGIFRPITGMIWATVGLYFPTWEDWNEPWNSSQTTSLNPHVIGGNQQGFILIKNFGTGEGTSLTIQSFSGNVVTSPDHCLNNGDFIEITGCIGTIGYNVNNKIFKISAATTNTFMINLDSNTGTYFGGGLITRLYVPFIQTKEFPTAWGLSRKTRIGPQLYLLSSTAKSQIQLLIFLSQNFSGDALSGSYNRGSIVPTIAPAPSNNSLIYSTVLYTCPESTNLGLSPESSNMADSANTNLQMVTANQQAQIWHRVNTSLVGDTVQLGFTISNEQMQALSPLAAGVAITAATQENPCVITCTGLTGVFAKNTLVTITDVQGMTELNDNTYYIIDFSATTLTIAVDSTAFTAFTSSPDALATPVGYFNPEAEIELHGIILDVSPSQILA